MTIANVATRRGYGTSDCGGAQIRAHCRHLATVVTVRGDIDAVNVGRVSEYIRRFIIGSNSVVLDFTDVSHFAAAGISLLHMVDDDCRDAGVEWILVASPAVAELMGVGFDRAETLFPVARSVREALRSLADAIVSRRQLVLPLVKKTA
ncbi:STAS domain-containing protein [Mycobacterium heidelbergense]|uniref:STAS domain-containing protein n=1 Tax=Mycobacterium heidelbergense TaxID=53376 RepID=A0A1X0DLE3_MYCHE|nr:STAS domain-containing protein [Mycobacterium heidelbergense]MCV7050246.1 STAS domain-containing protein [Mycobacterium heidelbergense]ORA72972.1 STAS domain-containing protein [Mycobacterium heidelbergense]BBZ49607.1 sulfate transporter [Mycobacterium heidelbergense]